LVEHLDVVDFIAAPAAKARWCSLPPKQPRNRATERPNAGAVFCR
jgi:hypothetical protein